MWQLVTDTSNQTITFDVGANVLQIITLLVVLVNTIISAQRTKQLKPNGGSSVFDKVNAIYDSMERRKEQPTQVEATLEIKDSNNGTQANS